MIDATIEALKYKDLPDHIQIAETDMVTNPFNWYALNIKSI